MDKEPFPDLDREASFVKLNPKLSLNYLTGVKKEEIV
jgi:hypothetical protein